MSDKSLVNLRFVVFIEPYRGKINIEIIFTGVKIVIYMIIINSNFFYFSRSRAVSASLSGTVRRACISFVVVAAPSYCL